MAWLYFLVGGFIGALFGFGAYGLLTSGKVEDLEATARYWEMQAMLAKRGPVLEDAGAGGCDEQT